MIKLRLLLRHIREVATSPRYPNIHPSAVVAPNVRVTNADNLYLGEYASLGDGAQIINLRAKFIMKKYSFSGPDLMVVTGNHMAIVGTPMRFVDDNMKDELDKNHEYDKDITVDEDVWLGARVTLLSGVHIGRGSIICAGAVVTKDVPPYSIFGGVPGNTIKFRWTIEQIEEHERSLYSEQERFTRAELERWNIL